MSTHEEKLLREIQVLEVSRDQAKVAVDNVLGLLKKADERRLQDGDRPWNRILDNLERALDLTRARLTTYGQLLKERQRQLEKLQQSGVFQVAEPESGQDSLEERVLTHTLREVLPEDVLLPRDHIRMAERILAIPLDLLGKLTLEQAARMNAQIFEMAEAESRKGPQGSPAKLTTKSWLEERIAHAKQAREALASNRRTETSFAERRRQAGLRKAVEKVVTGNINLLDLAETDLIVRCSKGLEDKPDKGENDLRLKGILDQSIEKVQERAAELRK
jgi:hypothetical protein